jgi:hypothetical protein
MIRLSDFVEKRLALMFPPDERDDARLLLVEECGENIPAWHSAGIDRLRCATLKLSHGELPKLRSAIDLAKRDFRDVLMAAEFGDPESYRTWLPKGSR